MRTGCDYSMSAVFETLQVHLQPQSLTKEINVEHTHRRISDKLHIQDEQLNKYSKLLSLLGHVEKHFFFQVFPKQVLAVGVLAIETYLLLLLALASEASVALGAEPAAGAACKTHSPSAPPSASGDASYSSHSS